MSFNNKNPFIKKKEIVTPVGEEETRRRRHASFNLLKKRRCFFFLTRFVESITIIMTRINDYLKNNRNLKLFFYIMQRLINKH